MSAIGRGQGTVHVGFRLAQERSFQVGAEERWDAGSEFEGVSEYYILFQEKMVDFQTRLDAARAKCLAQRKKERKERRKAEAEAWRKEEAAREGRGDGWKRD